MEKARQGTLSIAQNCPRGGVREVSFISFGLGSLSRFQALKIPSPVEVSQASKLSRKLCELMNDTIAVVQLQSFPVASNFVQLCRSSYTDMENKIIQALETSLLITDPFQFSFALERIEQRKLVVRQINLYFSGVLICAFFVLFFVLIATNFRIPFVRFNITPAF